METEFEIIKISPERELLIRLEEAINPRQLPVIDVPCDPEPETP